MKHLRIARLLVLAFAAFLALSGAAQKKPLDHSVYDSWRSIRNSALSKDGSWALWIEAPQVGDADLLVAPTSGGQMKKLPRPSTPRFTSDSKFVVYLTVPPDEEMKKARQEKRKPKDMPRNHLTILNLATGETQTIESVQSFSLPSEDKGWVLYRPYSFEEEETQSGKTEEQKQEEATQEPQHRKGQRLGSEHILRHIASGEEIRLAFVTEFVWYDDGSRLVYAVSSKNPSEDGVYVFDVMTKESKPIVQGIGEYKSLAIHSKTGRIYFTSDHDTYADEKPTRKSYYYDGSSLREIVLSDGIEEGFQYAERVTVRFSDSGNRILFEVEPKKAEEKPKPSTSEDEKVAVDIWHWKDPWLQPMQLLRANQEKNRTFTCLYDIAKRRSVQLETPTVPDVAVGNGDGVWAIGSSDLPYRQLLSWDQTYYDIYLVNLETSDRILILQKTPEIPSLSPSGRWITWYQEDEGHWYAMDVAARVPVNLTADIGVPFYNELSDYPAYPVSYGSAGWTTNEQEFLIYDRYDIWAVDPTRQRPARCLTDGYGRRWDIRFRVLPLNREEDILDPKQPWLLSAFSERTKQSGFFRLEGTGLSKLILEDKRFGNPQKAEKSDTILVTREDFQEFPNLWATDTSFHRLTRLSDANPQQAEYLWGTEELVTWLSDDGIPLQGILLKPENFDPAKKYPMIVYFYERLSDDLHRHYVPSPGSSSINPSFYVSRGYVIFMPDIPYRVGYPGESAAKAILPGVQSILRRGFVDPKRIGMQGHSWGGYQVAYLITRTNLFACAEAGAPVANMFSAYGGIRWGSGMSRMFQYEKTQSRIGGTIWEMPLRFIENSPIFWLDKVETPLLILHNDQDGAVPWYQGIELFTGLRRLGKPAWMFNYNGEDHGLNKRVNRVDWTIRMQQFFDHFLKGEPAPVWLEEGIPATKKGEDLGLEPAKGGG